MTSWAPTFEDSSDDHELLLPQLSSSSQAPLFFLLAKQRLARL